MMEIQDKDDESKCLRNSALKRAINMSGDKKNPVKVNVRMPGWAIILDYRY